MFALNVECTRMTRAEQEQKKRRAQGKGERQKSACKQKERKKKRRAMAIFLKEEARGDQHWLWRQSEDGAGDGSDG